MGKFTDLKIIDFDFSKPMTLKDLLVLDGMSQAHHFDLYVTISDAYAEGIIPVGYEDAFPLTCDCGSEMIMSRNRKSFMCCNPRCYIKQGHTLNKLFNTLGVKNIGAATCIKLSKNFYMSSETHSPIEMLLEDYVYYESVVGHARAMTIRQGITELRNRALTFSDMAKLLAIPGFGTDVKFFDYFNSVAVFVETIGNYGSVRAMLAAGGVFDTKKIFHLWLCLVDILMVEQHLIEKVIGKGKKDYIVCITGHLCPGGIEVSRDKYIDLCNSFVDKRGERVYNVKAGKALESADVVIADYPSTSRTYLAGKRRGILMDSTSFLSKLEEEIASWE